MTNYYYADTTNCMQNGKISMAS